MVPEQEKQVVAILKCQSAIHFVVPVTSSALRGHLRWSLPVSQTTRAVQFLLHIFLFAHVKGRICHF